MLLTNTMRAVGRLVLRGHVPPRVVVNDHIGRRQVKAHAARLERNQKDRNLARLELRDHLGAALLRRSARELKEGDVLLGQALTDNIEHTRKLAEQ